jgi:hypothetical protein
MVVLGAWDAWRERWTAVATVSDAGAVAFVGEMDELETQAAVEGL